MINRKHHYAVIVLFVLGGMSAGCNGRQESTASGKVTIDGHAVDGGMIYFIPTESSERQEEDWCEIVGGQYSAGSSGRLVQGRYRVEIRWPKKTGRTIQLPPPAQQNQPIAETIEAIPVRYNSESELTVDLAAGENSANFELSTR